MPVRDRRSQTGDLLIAADDGNHVLHRTLTVMPHVHALVDCHDFGDEQVERLRLHLSNWHNQFGEPVVLQPDIDVRPICTPKSLLDRTRYLYKPINLASPYDTAWANHIGDDRTRAWELNSQARELAAGVFEARKDRTRMFSKGTLNPRDRRFIGIPKDERVNHSEYIRDLQRQPAEYPEELLDTEATNDTPDVLDGDPFQEMALAE